MHQITHRWKLGFALAFTTAVMWGLLPIAIKVLFHSMDSWTITFYRFIGAALMMGAYLAYKKQIPSPRTFNTSIMLLLGICILGLCANYILFLFGLDLTTPSTTQVLIQLAPMLLLFGGLYIFKEKFSKIQWLGFVLFIVGLLLFFNIRLKQIISAEGDFASGVFYIIAAAITWAAYALAQKQLLKDYSSIAVMFMILVAGTIIFAPLTQFSQILQLDTLGLVLLIFSSLNTAIAYGAFAEALNHWEASRVSAVLSLTPVITVISLEILSSQYPLHFKGETLSSLTIAGISVVVVGSMLVALGKHRSAGAEDTVTEQPTAEL